MRKASRFVASVIVFLAVILSASASESVESSGSPDSASSPDSAELSDSAGSSDSESQVAEIERAFAKTMADRDHVAFESFLSDEAVFLSGRTTLAGRKAVATQWEAFFEGPEPPFSWEPETVSVLDSGELAISTGPVWDAAGIRISTYTSIWRQEAPGVWKIIFDRGNKFCE